MEEGKRTSMEIHHHDPDIFIVYQTLVPKPQWETKPGSSLRPACQTGAENYQTETPTSAFGSLLSSLLQKACHAARQS